MLGAIIGDIVGSRFEFDNTNSVDFELFTDESTYTDDTICTVAIADAILNGKSYKDSLLEWCRKYPNPKGAYGGSFVRWINSADPQPYNSFGNGSAMRVSPIGWAFDSYQEVLKQAELSAAVSHNHPEGIKGAVCIAHMIWAGRHQASKDDLYQISYLYYPNWERTMPAIGRFDETCQGTIPTCFWALFHANSFEDAIRKAIAFGGDSDTIGAIVGSVAETLWELPGRLRNTALSKLPSDMRNVIELFYVNVKSPDYFWVNIEPSTDSRTLIFPDRDRFHRENRMNAHYSSHDLRDLLK